MISKKLLKEFSELSSKEQTEYLFKHVTDGTLDLEKFTHLLRAYEDKIQSGYTYTEIERDW